MNTPQDSAPSKVPQVTLVFWVIKIAATTLGETGGDAVSMSMHLGYLAASGIFLITFALAVWAQVHATRFHAYLYWFAIIASTTVGTTLADFTTRSLGVGYSGGSAILLVMLATSFWCWHRRFGNLSVASIRSPGPESFYWLTIMFSQTLGTALGDWVADTAGLGYTGGMLIFGSLLAIAAMLYFWTRLSHTLLFWFAFIVTRPLGAVLGDFLDKPLASGGLALDRYAASLLLLTLIVACITLFPQRAAERAH